MKGICLQLAIEINLSLPELKTTTRSMFDYPWFKTTAPEENVGTESIRNERLRWQSVHYPPGVDDLSLQSDSPGSEFGLGPV
jgi:hypothetical protein